MDQDLNVEMGSTGTGEQVKSFCTGAALRVCSSHASPRGRQSWWLLRWCMCRGQGQGRTIPGGCSCWYKGVSKPGIPAATQSSCQVHHLKTVLLSLWDPWHPPLGSGNLLPSSSLDSSLIEQNSLISGCSKDQSNPMRMRCGLWIWEAKPSQRDHPDAH